MEIDEIVAKTEATVAALPERWEDMTAESSEVLATFLHELEGVAGAVIAYQQMILDSHTDERHDGITLDQAINEGVIPENAVIGVAESEVAWVEVTKAQMVIQTWMATAGHPRAFDRTALDTDN